MSPDCCSLSYCTKKLINACLIGTTPRLCRRQLYGLSEILLQETIFKHKLSSLLELFPPCSHFCRRLRKASVKKLAGPFRISPLVHLTRFKLSSMPISSHLSSTYFRMPTSRQRRKHAGPSQTRPLAVCRSHHKLGTSSRKAASNLCVTS